VAGEGLCNSRTLEPKLLETVSKEDTWEARIERPCLLTLPLSVKSLKTSRRSRSCVFLLVEVARVEAWTTRSLAFRRHCSSVRPEVAGWIGAGAGCVAANWKGFNAGRRSDVRMLLPPLFFGITI
jgi:hypothetical protein